MRKIIIMLFAILLSTVLMAQTPQAMNYQAVVRNATGELVTSSVLGVKITILKNGLYEYSEIHNPITNGNGLMTIIVGEGITTDIFSEIPWSTGVFDIKTEIDLLGGSNYTISGTSSLLTVPYAMHSSYAETSGSSLPGPEGAQGETGEQGIQGETGEQGIPGLLGIPGEQGETGDQGIQGDTGDQGIQGETGDQGIQGETGDQGIPGEDGIGVVETYTIGFDSTMGGYIFYVTPNGLHGLVATDIDANGGNTVTWWTAENNVCMDTLYQSTLTQQFTDWYLPSKSELVLLRTYRIETNMGSSKVYWSSSLNSNGLQAYQLMMNHLPMYDDFPSTVTQQGSALSVRCIRNF